MLVWVHLIHHLWLQALIQANVAIWFQEIWTCLIHHMPYRKITRAKTNIWSFDNRSKPIFSTLETLVDSGSAWRGIGVTVGAGLRVGQALKVLNSWCAHQRRAIQETTWSQLKSCNLVDLNTGSFLIIKPFFPIHALKNTVIIVWFLPNNLIVLPVNIRFLHFRLIYRRNDWFFNFFLKDFEFRFRNKASQVIIPRTCRLA